MALAAVEIGSGLVAAIEDHRIAAPRVADRHGEKRPCEVVRQPGARRVRGVDRVGLPLEPLRKHGVVGGQACRPRRRPIRRWRAGGRRRPARETAPPKPDAANASARSPGDGRPRRGCGHGEWFRRPLEMTLGADELAVEQPVCELGRKFVRARDQVDEARSDADPRPVRACGYIRRSFRSAYGGRGPAR